MRKKVATKLITLLMALLLMVTAIPTGNVTAQAAAKKPGAVTKITKSEVNPTTITIQYNKAKNAKGYQIRTYKGKKLVKSVKVKDTSYTVKGLSAETKYTIKVRAYNGSKYGKEKSIIVKTETKNLAVTSLKAVKVTNSSVKLTYKKAQNAKGYQIRVYKGSKQVADVKTKNTSYTVKDLSAGTKYTVKVRAYKGSKYGKEKTVTFKTAGGDDSLDITNIKVTEVGQNSIPRCYVKLEYNKTKIPSIYEVSIYKGNELIYNTETSDNTFYYGGLLGETEYTIKVRAYPDPWSGKKTYGKEASVTVKTPQIIVMPGTSTSEGEQLIAEYNAYVLYTAESLKNSKVIITNPMSRWDTPFWGAFMHIPAMFQYDTAYDDKYSLFKYKAGTPNAIVDFEVDVLNACDYGFQAERYYNVAEDMIKVCEQQGITITSYPNEDAFVFTMDGERIVWAEDSDYMSSGSALYSLTKLAELEATTYRFVGNCPDCGRELFCFRYTLSDIPDMLQRTSAEGIYSYCDCTGIRKNLIFKVPYTVDDIPTLPHYIKLTELVPEKNYHFFAACPDCGEIMESTWIAENMPWMLQNMAASDEKTMPFWCDRCGEGKDFKLKTFYTIDDLPTMPHYIILEKLVTQ